MVDGVSVCIVGVVGLAAGDELPAWPGVTSVIVDSAFVLANVVICPSTVLIGDAVVLAV